MDRAPFQRKHADRIKAALDRSLERLTSAGCVRRPGLGVSVIAALHPAIRFTFRIDDALNITLTVGS